VPPKNRKTYQEAIAQLNQRQREAFDEPGNTVLLAGPGSGKTATLVLKVARLLDETPPPRGLACLTYGNEAAREFELRLRDFGIRSGGQLFTGTVHSFCLAHILRPFAFRLDSEHRHLATAEVASDTELKNALQAGLDAAGVSDPPSWWKSKLEEYRKLALIEPTFAERLDDRLPRLSNGYAAHLKSIGRIDFDDIVLGSLMLVRRDGHVRRALAAKYPWLVVDEYQDLGLALHCMVRVLLDEADVKVFAVGDPDQSIYSFSGARPEFLNELSKRRNVRSVRLELNYRCRQRIIDASLYVLQPEQDRAFVSATEDEERGEIVFERCKDGLEQQAAYVVARVTECIARGIPPGEIGVFAKRWGDLGPCEQALARAHIPYRIVRREYKSTPLTTWVESMALWCAGGWRSAKPRMLEIFRGWQRLKNACRGSSASSADLAERIAIYRTLSRLRDPAITVSEWTEAIVSSLDLGPIASAPDAVPIRMRYDARELATMLASLSRRSVGGQTLADFSGTDSQKVVLQSLHASKGLEYTTVFMLALENGIIPQRNENHNEARRLFYVGMTRARREVHLIWSGFFITAKGHRSEKGHSPFLPELWRRLNPNAT
jgi:DNA helicase-2/ATP-dependent DNA helicase PcrA